jgi:Trypsin-like peptidase domain
MKNILLFLLLSVNIFAQKKESWMNKPKDQWPPIALTNNVAFNNGDTYIHSSFKYAATGFLIDNGSETLAATGKHILWVAKNKKSKAVEINKELKSWTMFPKGNSKDVVVIDKLINEDSTEILEGKNATITERDWIIFSVKSASPNIVRLKPRYTPLKVGEKVYIPGCAYNDSTCKVYEGTILRKQGLDILIERNMNEHMGGSSGSPVIDANGYLIGILSSSSSDGQTGKGVTVAISTEYLRDVLHKKQGLNIPKKDYGKLIFETTLKQGSKQAIEQYKQLASNPKNYYIYNLRSADRNGLRETGEKLIEQKRVNDAIAILKFNTEVNPNYFLNFNLLAQAYLLDQNKTEAIKAYEISTKKFDSKVENEAFKALEKLSSEK